MLPVEQPFKTYTGLDGKPLENGYVYFGQPDQNPITAPVTVYWDAAGTIPAAQPLRTVGGYIMRAGSPANVFFTGSCSVVVLDSKKRQVFYARSSDEFSIATTVSNFLESAAGSGGAALIGFAQAGADSVVRTVGAKLRDIIDAADKIETPGFSADLDKAGVQAAVNEMAARGGGVVRVRKPIGNWDLSTLAIPATVMIEDDRYSDSGWKQWHSEGDDAQLGLRGRATPGGEGPCIVLQNLASTGNRNVSFVHWYGPSHAPVVASYEHWGYNADSTWYAGRQWLSKGSIDTGARARTRQGNDGGIVFNPNGDANSFKNNPAVGFGQDYLFVWNAPSQAGYAHSGKNLMNLKAGALELPIEMHLHGANPTIRFQSAAGANRFALIGDFPSAGQIALHDAIAGVNKQVWTSGGDTVHTGTFRPSDDNAHNLGSGSSRWATVYAGTGTISTSDRDEKDEIQAIHAAALRAAGRVDFMQFKFKDAVAAKGDGARWHFGVIAQQVKEAFEAEGLDGFAYGVLCFDEWAEEWLDHPAVYRDSTIVGADGKPEKVLVEAAWREKVRDAGNRYGVRYDELLALQCAYLRSRLAGF